MEKLRVGSLFSGIGGLDLGLERAGFEIAWMCEIKPYVRKILAQNFPGVPIYEDITKITEVPYVDALAGGFPCQDISIARRRRKGIEGDKSGLWSEYSRLIRTVRPRYAIVENVGDLLRKGMGRVLGDLAESGYDAEWEVLPAYPFGSPQRRERVIIVAYPNSERLERERVSVFLNGPARLPLWGVWPTQSDVLRAGHGVPYYMERIEGLGNAVVPQVAQFVAECVKAHAERSGLL